MQNYNELTKLLTIRESAKDVLEDLEESKSLGKGKGLAHISGSFRFNSDEEFKQIHELVLDIAQRRVDTLDYKLSMYRIEKDVEDPNEEAQREVYERLKAKFQDK